MSKVIVFEGISGSGKSFLIDKVMLKSLQSQMIKWFDNEYSIDLLSGIQKDIPVSHDFFSVCYAMDFYGKYKYRILPALEKTDLILHRYIYTPLSHDLARGTDSRLLNRLYKAQDFLEPDLIVYMDTAPETAYERIIRTRKPSFYECGLDSFMFNDLDQAKQDFKNGKFSENELKEYYLEFQSKVSDNYSEVLKGKSNVLRVKPDNNIDECADCILSRIGE